jgi:tRNA (guanine6-N2)-methyltransferase
MNIEELIKQGTYPRNYRLHSQTSSLNPAVAFALNHVAGLDDKDRVLDPCCGTGTILIERQLLKPCICVGVDIDPRAIVNAKENATAAEVTIDFKHGDITNKHFPDNYFTKIITNLPFGLHSGSREHNKVLYRFLADEGRRWLKIGGIAVLLTNAKSLLRNSFAFNGNWELVDESEIKLGGLHLSLFVYRRLS